ncbi:MAG: cellulase family glycosylhydrolase, partial [Cyanobacteria bacterium J06639_18]
IGEFGGRQTDDQSVEGIWQQRLVDYINEHDLSYAYWSWNPNSDDTGGILLDDWQQIDVEKQALLAKTLP